MPISKQQKEKLLTDTQELKEQLDKTLFKKPVNFPTQEDIWTNTAILFSSQLKK